MTGSRRASSRGAAERPSRVRVLVVSLAAGGAAAVAALAFVSRAPSAPPDRFPAEETADPPPRFERPRTEAERLGALIQILLASDPDDTERARSLLLAAGEPGREAVAATVRHILESNTAFAQHAFDLLLLSPRPSDVPLAIAGLSSRDPDVVSRAAALLGRVGPSAAEALPNLASAARQGYPMSEHACGAMAKLGSPEAEAELVAIAVDAAADAGARQQAMVALGTMPRLADRTVAALRAVADVTRGTPESRQTYIAAASSLATRKDPHVLPGLREDFDLRRDPQALNLLSRANDEAALREIVARLDAKLEDTKRRLEALFLLEFFPPDVRIPILRRAIESIDDEDTLAAAWELLGKTGSEEVAGEMRRLLRSEAAGARGPQDRKVATLVLGGLRKPEDSRALLDAAERAAAAGDEELRMFALRGAMLCGDPAAAEPIVRVWAADASPVDAPISVAANLGSIFPEAPPAFRRAAAPHVVRALRGEFGALGEGALLQFVLAAAAACGEEASPAVQTLLRHDRREVREAAARFLGMQPGPDGEASLRAAWWGKQDRYTRAEIARSLSWVPLAKPVP
ncbi:MAG: hypothetical protein HMLKMBBP_03333 [Planctomycetes bacterium]|nr:hypothetical protein [Planctomycetota bacterium]